MSGFAAVTNLRLKPRHLGVGRKQLALRRMHAVAGGKMSFTRFLEPRFGFAQSGVLRLEFDKRTLDFPCQTFAFHLRFVAPQQPQQLLCARQFVAVLAILPGHGGLPLEAFHLRAQFQTDILDASQVLAGIGNTALGFLAPLLVFGDPGRFFQKNPQLVGPRLDDA